MEYINHGDLRNYLEVERSESEAKAITRQLLEGLVVIHQEGFAHRDLKPEVRPPVTRCKRPTYKGIEHLCGLHVSRLGQNRGLWAGKTCEGRHGFPYTGIYSWLFCSRGGNDYHRRFFGVHERCGHPGDWVHHSRDSDAGPPVPEFF